MRSVYHLVEEANWPFIQQEGLWPAQALLERPAVPRPHRAEGQYREENLVLPDGRMLRDQRPMPPAALAACLDPAMAPQDWYALVNRKVFFWWDLERLNRHRAACGRRPQRVLVVDLQALLARYAAIASVAPINTGYALRKAA
ncbi:hypothetical protein, partial [Ramlibacter sp.]|uniref:DUF7002 family protein n=1 Tax=Ramlibacter sp. TaxID=1917967 RepID=UPI0017F99727